MFKLDEHKMYLRSVMREYNDVAKRFNKTAGEYNKLYKKNEGDVSSEMKSMWSSVVEDYMLLKDIKSKAEMSGLNPDKLIKLKYRIGE